MKKKERVRHKVNQKQINALNSMSPRFNSLEDAEKYLDGKRGSIPDRIIKGKKVITNPEWVNAPYEITYRFFGKSYKV